MTDIARNIRLHITNRCNHQCVMCDRWSWDKDAHGDLVELDTSKYISFFNELISLGVWKVTFTGGEPTLRGDLPELICHALQRGLHVSIVTNGELLLASVGKWTAIPGVPGPNFAVAVSLLGLKEVHDKHCGRKGSFDRVIAGIQELVKAGINTSIFFTVLPGNVEQLVEACGIAKEIGVMNVRFGLLHGYGELAFGEKELASLKRQFEDLNKMRKREKYEHGKKVFHASYQWYIQKMLDDGTLTISDFQEKRPARSILDTPRDCPYVDNLAFMNPYGDIYPCHYAEFSNQDYTTYAEERSRYVMGNVRKQTFAEIWQTPAYKNLRARVHPIQPTDQEIRHVCEQCIYLCESFVKAQMEKPRKNRKFRSKS